MSKHLALVAAILCAIVVACDPSLGASPAAAKASKDFARVTKAYEQCVVKQALSVVKILYKTNLVAGIDKKCKAPLRAFSDLLLSAGISSADVNEATKNLRGEVISTVGIYIYLVLTDPGRPR